MNVVRYSPDGNLLLTGSSDQKVSFRQPRAFKIHRIIHVAPLICSRFSLSFSLLQSFLYDGKTGKVVSELGGGAAPAHAVCFN